MPWIRTIASGPNALGDLAGQSWNVAQTNLRTQEGDIARRNAAEQGWNRWNANVADLANQQEVEQYRRGEVARVAKENTFRWGAEQADRSDARKIDRERIAATLGLQEKAEAKDLAAIDNAANNFKKTVADRGSALDTAEKAWREATSKLNLATSTIVQDFGDDLIRFDNSRGVKAFVTKGQPDDDKKGTKTKAAIKAAARANERIAQLATQHTFAEDALGEASRTFDGLQKQLGNFNLTVDKRDGKWVVINSAADPDKAEYRWVPQAIVGPPRPVPANMQPPGRWSAPTDVPASPQMPPVETSSEQAIRQAFPTPDAVRAAALSGQLSREQAIEILTTAF